ncbi:MAG TPA: hypothetical protein VFZ59_19305 [Verrucomicrobiae bacterium]|nr:hypothetical protein [Verrucomicrobiae bacterium]
MDTDYSETNYVTRPVAAVVRRISWGAVFAGLAVVMVTQLTLGILGIGIGLGVVNLQDDQPDQALQIGALVWFLFTALLSLFLGGHVAARLAGVPRREDSCWHGILTWSAQTIATVLLLTTAVGGALGGMMGLLGQGLSGGGQGLAAIVSKEGMGGVGQAVEQITGQDGVNWDTIKEDAKSLTANTNQMAEGEPAATSQEVQRALGRMFNRSGEQVNPNDREALIGAVQRYTGMPREEAAQKVASWEQMYQEARSKVQETKEEAKEVAGTAAKGISKVALWTFVTLVFGAAAAALGGLSGRPKTMITEGRP